MQSVHSQVITSFGQCNRHCCCLPVYSHPFLCTLNVPCSVYEAVDRSIQLPKLPVMMMVVVMVVVYVTRPVRVTWHLQCALCSLRFSTNSLTKQLMGRAVKAEILVRFAVGKEQPPNKGPVAGKERETRVLYFNDAILKHTKTVPIGSSSLSLHREQGKIDLQIR